MLGLNKNYPKNGPVCHTCFVRKEFGFGVRWKSIIFGWETGKSKKTPIYFGNFCSQQGKLCLFCGGASLPSFCALFYFPFPLCFLPASMDALPAENLQELLLTLLFSEAQS